MTEGELNCSPEVTPAEAGEWGDVFLRTEPHSPVLPTPASSNELSRRSPCS